MKRSEFIDNFLQITQMSLEEKLPEETSELILTQCALIIVANKMTHVLSEAVRIRNG